MKLELEIELQKEGGNIALSKAAAIDFLSGDSCEFSWFILELNFEGDGDEGAGRLQVMGCFADESMPSFSASIPSDVG